MNSRLSAVVIAAALLMTGCGGPDYDPVQAEEDCERYYSTAMDQVITVDNVEDVTEKVQDIADTAIEPVARVARQLIEPDWLSDEEESEAIDEYNRICERDIVLK